LNVAGFTLDMLLQAIKIAYVNEAVYGIRPRISPKRVPCAPEILIAATDRKEKLMEKRGRLRSLLSCIGQRKFGCAMTLLITGGLLMIGCSKNVNTGNSNAANKAAQPSSSNSNASGITKQRREEIKGMADQQGQATAQDKGNFKVIYSEPENAKYALMKDGLERSGTLDLLVDELNATVAIPVDVTVMFKQCGEVNAKWSLQDHSIYMCYELMDDVAQRLGPLTKSRQDLEEAVGGATMFVFFHEVGHCLVDLLKLPVTGREEEAVDQLEAYVFVDSADDEIERMALKGAYWWGHKYDEMPQPGKTDGSLNQLWTDAHSFNAQRFFSIICWVYGHNPDKYQDIVNNLLPEARAALCPQEYARLYNAWADELKPYLKDGGANAVAQAQGANPGGGSRNGP
jgi:hypothetical protein